MARLQANSGESVSLNVAGYEFPERVPTGEHDLDANWLVIELIARLEGQAWAARFPALMTWDVGRLADWMEQLLRAGHVDTVWEGTEPMVAFDGQLVGENRYEVVVRLTHEFRPPVYDEFTEFRSFLEVSAQALFDFIGGLRMELATYPVRVGITG